MSPFTDLSSRSSDTEIMDDLNCAGPVVDQTLRELDVINRWLGGNSITLNGINKMIRSLAAKHEVPISIADLGCGSGELLRRMADTGRRERIPLRLVGIDANPNIVEFARAHCRDYPEISFQVLNVWSPEFASQQFDIITGTLFFHHFDNASLSRLLVQLSRQALQGILINDIHRHWLAYHSIRTLTRLFSKSSMVRFDAPLSVRRAFNRRDWHQILSASGIEKYLLRWKWAFRWKIVISTSGSRLAQFW